MSTDTTNVRYNIVIAGQTGVGKSSFINYLYGDDVVKTGIGKPVTAEGFHRIDCLINGLPVSIYDSWGIEADKYEQWCDMLDRELKKRGSDAEASEWFHSIFYCIQAPGHRITNGDIGIIKRFINEKYTVNVIFTKSHSVTIGVITALQETLQEALQDFTHLRAIPVNSVQEMTLGGHESKCFGRDEVVQAILKQFWDSITDRIPGRCATVARQEIKKWQLMMDRHIRDEAGYFNKDEVRETLKMKAKELESKVIDAAANEVLKVVDMFIGFCQTMNYLPASFINQKPYLDFNRHFKKPNEPDIPWWGWPIISALLVPGLVAVSIWMREDNRNELLHSLSQYCTELEKVLLPEIEQQAHKTLLLYRTSIMGV